MGHPRISYIHGDTPLNHLTKIQALNDMFLVTEVFLCPTYSLYLSSGRECPCTLDPITSFSVENLKSRNIHARGEAKRHRGDGP
jgi:hypothetical protein